MDWTSASGWSLMAASVQKFSLWDKRKRDHSHFDCGTSAMYLQFPLVSIKESTSPDVDMRHSQTYARLEVAASRDTLQSRLPPAMILAYIEPPPCQDGGK